MVTAKTMATVHHGDRDLVRWLLPLFFDRVGMASDEEARRQLMELFDTPARVVIEFDPVEFFTYSTYELGRAVVSSGFDRWGDGTTAERRAAIVSAGRKDEQR